MKFSKPMISTAFIWLVNKERRSYSQVWIFTVFFLYSRWSHFYFALFLLQQHQLMFVFVITQTGHSTDQIEESSSQKISNQIFAHTSFMHLQRLETVWIFYDSIKIFNYIFYNRNFNLGFWEIYYLLLLHHLFYCSLKNEINFYNLISANKIRYVYAVPDSDNQFLKRATIRI